MINIHNWFWYYKRRIFHDYVFGFFKIFSICVSEDGIELTIAYPENKIVLTWWRKYLLTWNPIDFDVYKN